MTVIVVSAPGKTILHGEHAVVFGKAAVAVSLGLRTTVTLISNSEKTIDVRFDALNYNCKWDLPDSIHFQPPNEGGSDVIPSCETYLEKVSEHFHVDQTPGSKIEQAVTAFLFLYSAVTEKYTHGQPKGACITCSSELPIGAGLGSSASFAVALSASLLCLYDQISCNSVLSDDHLSMVNKWAFQAERILHGKPSGIDNSICTYGGALLFQKGQIVEKISRLPEIKIILINTEVPRNTKLLVAQSREVSSKYPEILEPIWASIDAISLKQWSVLQEMAKHGKENVDNFILKDLVSINHHLLNSIGVGHPKLDQIFKMAAEMGLPSKLTGAGGGGCALVFLNPDTDLADTSNVFTKAGFNVYQADLAGRGVCFH